MEVIGTLNLNFVVNEIRINAVSALNPKITAHLFLSFGNVVNDVFRLIEEFNITAKRFNA